MPGGSGLREAAVKVDYHTMTNNAVLPSGAFEDPVKYHYHTKVMRDRSPKLAPILRPSDDFKGKN